MEGWKEAYALDQSLVERRRLSTSTALGGILRREEDLLPVLLHVRLYCTQAGRPKKRFLFGPYFILYRRFIKSAGLNYFFARVVNVVVVHGEAAEEPPIGGGV